MRVGDYVQLMRAGEYGPSLRIPRGTRGTVTSLDTDWARIELPQGGRFEAHMKHLAVLVHGETI